LILQKALIDFSGSLILVSHDVDFLRPIASKIVDIRKGKLKTYLGDIDYFLSKRELSSLERDAVAVEKKEKVEGVNRKEQKRLEAELRQQKHLATKELTKEISRWEIKISSYENLVKDLENKLADPSIYSDGEAAKDITNRFNKTKSELELANKKWEELTEKLLEIESKFA
jgi:ATP-binding cassette subfamily F protein 3